MNFQKPIKITVLHFNFILIIAIHSAKAAADKPAAQRICDDRPELSLERSIKQEGFHRELETTIYTRSKIKSKSKSPHILIIESLPSGMFADPHQLKTLASETGSQMLVSEKVNGELMQHQAKGQSVFAFLTLNTTESTVSIPVHLRYYRPQHCSSSGMTVSVKVQPPDIYFRPSDAEFPSLCSGLTEAPCGWNSHSLCSWQKVDIDMNRALSADVPVGCSEDRFLVSTVTLITYCSCAIIIAYFISVRGKKTVED